MPVNCTAVPDDDPSKCVKLDALPEFNVFFA
jgi:hypothetical protein